MVEHHDVAFELPAGLRVQLGRDHHHAFPDLRSLDFLQGKRGRLAAPNLGHRHPEIGGLTQSRYVRHKSLLYKAIVSKDTVK